MNKLKRIILLGLIITLHQMPLTAQWAQKANFGGSSRAYSTGFSIGNKVYLFGGMDSFALQDFWEYNVTTNTWTQKANFPGGFRAAAVAFTIGNKGYIGTGSNSGFYYNDFWEYDPLTDTWTQKANFPGSPRDEAAGFAIGAKGYIGTGQKFFTGANNSFNIAYNDFWEYDPSTNTWVQKANVPNGPRMYASGCSIGNKGYLGFGSDAQQSVSYSDFYEYDPSTDTWTQKNGTLPVSDAGLFVIGTDCYLIGGLDFATFTASTFCRRYNSLTDTWFTDSNFPGGIIASPVTAVSNGQGYVGTGFDASLNPRNDWWQYTPASVVTALSETKQKALEQLITIYPNPVKTELTVVINKNLKVLSSYFTILNTLGEEVFSGSLLNSAGMEQKIQLPGSLSQGVYTFILLNHNKTKIAARKMIKD